MILANLRERLTNDDYRFAADALGRREPARAAHFRALAADRAAALFDVDGLPALLRDAPGYAAPSAALFAFVAVRHALVRAGLDEVRLADYCAALLFEFGMRDRAYRIQPHDDATYRHLADIVAGLTGPDPRRRFLLQAHLGNFSLWLAGIFPDFVTARRERRGGPDFDYYESLGARGFRMASDDALAHELDMADIYAQAATDFATIRVALNRVSDQAFFRAVATPDRVLRQVADDARHPGGTTPLF